MIENISDNYSKSNVNENWLFQLFNQESYLAFDGSNDYINFGTTTSSSPTSVTADISVAFWFNFPESGSNEFILDSNSHSSNYSGYFVVKDFNDKITFQIGDNTGQANPDRVVWRGSTALSPNTWYFVVITSTFNNNASATNIYINNVAETVSLDIAGATTTEPIYNSGGKFYIGRGDYTTGDSYGKFYLKNLAIWSIVLNSSNRTATYNSGNLLSLHEDKGNYNNSGNLKAYFEFNTGENYIQDLTDNALSGSIIGATYKDFLPLAYRDTTVDDIFYHGFINSSGAVRDTIDLNTSKAKSSNISFTVSNFLYKGQKLYEDILFGSKYYINKVVKIFSQPDETPNINECVQIYNGRLTDISITEKNIINFQTASKTPWDFITFPQQKTNTTQQYIPIVYGNYTANTYGDKVTSMDYLVYPSPILRVADPNILTISTKAESSITPHHYEPNVDAFIPINTSNFTSATKNSSSSFDSNCSIAELDNTLKRSFKTRPVSITGSDGHESGSNRLLLHSGSTQGMAYSGQGTANTSFNFPSINGKITELNTLIKANVSIIGSPTGTSFQNVNILFGSASAKIVNADNASSSGTVDTSSSFTGYTAYDNRNILSNYESANFTLPSLTIRTTIQNNQQFGATGTTNEFLAHYVVENDFDNEDKSKATYKELEKLKYIYLGNDGLESSIIDTTTVSGVITKGLHAHRDLLARFTGYDVSDSNLYNWSSNLNVNSLRSNWSLRYWALKPVSLKNKLEQLQKEFGFIFKWRPNGEGSYWAVKNSYSSSDVATTLDYNDISNIEISHTPMSDLITKMEINYKKHPAEDKMLLSQTSQDSTTEPTPRSKWGIKNKENLLSVDLEMNVDAIGNEDVGAGGSDPNDGYADYYMHIFGDIKKIISCDIVNSSKGYILESGDIIKFNIDEIKPFGSNWNNYYMITSIQKSLGKIKIICREVG
tara:strand:- start:9375 stop:12212 length:2838 start_codon:yes stop_codon:yes gene_type:complete